MALKKKTISAILLVVLLVLGVGVIAFNVYRDKSLLQKIPVVKNLAAVKNSAGGNQTELEKIRLENDNLKKSLVQKDQEMLALQKEIADFRQQQSGASEARLKDELARVNKELLDLKTSQGSRKAAYQDMAKYFSAMKSKDAADILSRLENPDIIGILGQMTADTAAEILQNMDHDRAGQISREMLVTAPSGG